MARFYDLPEALVVEILFRLPADFLVELKCVCKLWYTVIKGPAFVAKNFQYTAKIYTSVLIQYIYYDPEAHHSIYKEELITTSNGNFHPFESAENIDIPTFPRYASWRCALVLQCNGLLCIPDLEERTFLLCNPVTKQSKVLSTSCIVQNFYQVTEMVGFGYDSRGNDYKVVRVTSFVNHEHANVHKGPSRAEVYSLRADSWREIRDIDIEANSIEHEYQAYNNGVYNWMVEVNDRLMLISFDMCDEEFDKIPIPDEMQMLDRPTNSISAWNESVAVLMFQPLSPSPFIDMWVMKKKSYCWTKHQTIILDGEIIRGPLVFCKNDELLLTVMPYEHVKLVSYNLGTGRIVDLPIKKSSWCSAISFSKSLVSLY